MKTARRPLMAGNWKMHRTVSEARALAQGLRDALVGDLAVDVVVCPPFTATAVVAEVLKGSAIHVGAQNMSWHAHGAYTGEISASMLKDAGASYVILGHSERRHLFGETDHNVRLKIDAALSHGLTPIVCVGETLAEREAEVTDNVVIMQVKYALQKLAAGQTAQLVFAYEPVWAIGTGKTCEADEADRVCGVIREVVAAYAGEEAADGVRILYGGSVKPETIAAQMQRPHVDGALVGGASLEVASFARIVKF